MSLPQNKLREAVFQILCSGSTIPLTEEILPLVMEQLKISKKNALLALHRAQDIYAHLPGIDEKIQKLSTSYDFSRIHQIELNALRLGAFEVLFDADIPDKVAISEAIRLCRKFSSKEGACFVNAILDALYKEKIGIVANNSDAIKEAAHNLESHEKNIHHFLDDQRDVDS